MNLPCLNITPSTETLVNHKEQETALLGYLTALIQGYDKQSNIIKSIVRDSRLSNYNKSVLLKASKNINPDKKF